MGGRGGLEACLKRLRSTQSGDRSEDRRAERRKGEKERGGGEAGLFRGSLAVRAAEAARFWRWRLRSGGEEAWIEAGRSGVGLAEDGGEVAVESAAPEKRRLQGSR